MLVPRVGSFQPALATEPAGLTDSALRPAAGGCATGTGSVLLRSPGRGSSRGRWPAWSGPGLGQPCCLLTPRDAQSWGLRPARQVLLQAEEGTQGPAPSSFRVFHSKEHRGDRIVKIMCR